MLATVPPIAETTASEQRKTGSNFQPAGHSKLDPVNEEVEVELFERPSFLRTTSLRCQEQFAAS